MGILRLYTMGCGASSGNIPPPSPEIRPDLEVAPTAWAKASTQSPLKNEELPTSPSPAKNADSVDSIQNFPGQLLQLDEMQGPVCPRSSDALTSKSRPSSADRIRPTTAGLRRKKKTDHLDLADGKEQAPEALGMNLKPSVWLSETQQAKTLHDQEKALEDVFSKKSRPGSAGSKRKQRAGGRQIASPIRGWDQNRPGSAEKRNQNEIKNSVWLSDKNQPNVVQLDCDAATSTNNRPRSGGRRNQPGCAGSKLQLDQNGRRPITP